MGYTFTQTIADNTKFYAVTAPYPCRNILIRENAAIPTQSFDIKEPAANSAIAKLSTGGSYVFNAGLGTSYATGDVVGWIQLTGANTSTQFSLVLS